MQNAITIERITGQSVEIPTGTSMTVEQLLRHPNSGAAVDQPGQSIWAAFGGDLGRIGELRGSDGRVSLRDEIEIGDTLVVTPSVKGGLGSD